MYGWRQIESPRSLYVSKDSQDHHRCNHTSSKTGILILEVYYTIFFSGTRVS